MVAGSTKNLFSVEAMTAATNSGSALALAPSDDDFLAYIKCTAVNGATTVSGKIQHSPDGSDWIDLVAFADQVGSGSSEVKTVSGPVFKHIRGFVGLAGVTKAATVTMELHHS